eukprot:1147598-Pelagomonas_calceolata.AAC.7
MQLPACPLGHSIGCRVQGTDCSCFCAQALLQDIILIEFKIYFSLKSQTLANAPCTNRDRAHDLLAQQQEQEAAGTVPDIWGLARQQAGDEQCLGQYGLARFPKVLSVHGAFELHEWLGFDLVDPSMGQVGLWGKRAGALTCMTCPGSDRCIKHACCPHSRSVRFLALHRPCLQVWKSASSNFSLAPIVSTHGFANKYQWYSLIAEVDRHCNILHL